MISDVYAKRHWSRNAAQVGLSGRHERSERVNEGDDARPDRRRKTRKAEGSSKREPREPSWRKGA